MLAGLMFIIHLVVSVALILIILLQTTKGSGMGAAFGGASQTLFGSTGRASFLTKVTVVAAVVFVITSIGLSFVWTEKSGVVDESTTAPGSGGLPSLPTSPGADANVPGANVPGANVPGEGGAPPTDAAPSGAPGPAAPGPVTPGPETPAAPPAETGSPRTPAPEAPGPEAPGPDSGPGSP